jgi:hypothetical protein
MDGGADLRELPRRRGIRKGTIDEAIEVLRGYAKRSAEALAHTT